MKIVILLVLIFQMFGYTQSVLTVEDAIRIGLKNNFDIKIARNNARIAQNNIDLGTAGFLPILDATGNYQYGESDQETNSPFSFGKSESNTYSGQIALNWTIFDGFRMFINRNKYHKLADLGDAQARNIIENNVVAILQAYFDLVQQEQLLDVAKSTLSISETRLNKEKVRREVGGASSTDLLNAQVSFNNDQASLLNQELRVVIALKDLNLLLGQNPGTVIEVEQDIKLPPLTMTIQELQELVLERNSVLVVSRKNNEISKDEVRIAKSNFTPILLLNSSYGYTDRTTSTNNPNFDNKIETQSKDGVVGLTLSWNLFNGFRDKINLQNAKIEAKNKQLSYENMQNQIYGLLREKYETFHKRIELLELEEQNVVAAEQNLQLQQDRYQIGTASSLEFRDAQVNLARAQISLIIARYQARITRLEIEQLIGNIEIQ